MDGLHGGKVSTGEPEETLNYMLPAGSLVLSCNVAFSEEWFLRVQLPNDTKVIFETTQYLAGTLVNMRYFTQKEANAIQKALLETLVNAFEHGNLEIPGKVKEKMLATDPADYYDLVEARRQIDPYQTRIIVLEVGVTAREGRFVIVDQGPGFDPESYQNQKEPPPPLQLSGRGIFLIQYFMDQLFYNTKGNQATLIKQRTLPYKNTSHL